MSSLPSRIKAIWNTYGIEIAKFCTVGGAAFVVNSVVVWTLMVTIMHDSHTKAKVIASIVATIFSWLMNRLCIRWLLVRSHAQKYISTAKNPGRGVRLVT